jgi:hypothetical protein
VFVGVLNTKKKTKELFFIIENKKTQSLIRMDGGVAHKNILDVKRPHCVRPSVRVQKKLRRAGVKPGKYDAPIERGWQTGWQCFKPLVEKSVFKQCFFFETGCFSEGYNVPSPNRAPPP